MAKMVKHAHEDHEIELFTKLRDIIGRQLAEFDLEPIDLSGEPRLCEVVVVGVEAEHAVGPAALHFHGVKSGVTADVENGHAFETVRDHSGKAPPFHPWIVAEKMRGRGAYAVEVEIVKPGAKRVDAAADLILGEHVGHAVAPLVFGEVFWRWMPLKGTT